MAFACGLLLSAAGDTTAGDLRLKTGTIALGQSLQTPFRRMVPGRSHYVVRFREPLSGRAAGALAARGIHVTGRISAGALVVAGGDDLVSRLDGLETLAVGRLAVADKLSPMLFADDMPPAFLVEFHPDVPPRTARDLIGRAGLDLLEHPDLLPFQLLVTGDAGRIAALAEWDEVAYVFPASLDLVAGIRLVGCAGAVMEDALVGQYVKVGQGWNGTGEIRYFIQNTTNKLPASNVESELIRALEEWTLYAPITFTRAAGATASRSVTILFGRRDHGCGYPFDGSGKVLAHTFYPAPLNPEPRAGDMHFDDDENWRIGMNVDLFTVALHEAGHALGLGHSDKPGAVMYPYYRQAAGLTADDIAGIRALYGGGDTTPGTPSTPADPPGPPAPALALVIVNPATSSMNTTSTAIAVSGQVQNASGQARVTWQSDRGAAGQATGSGAWNVAALPLSVGANTITLRATDAAGASDTRTLTVTRQEAAGIPGAGAPPSLRITSPGLSIVSTALASITLRGTASAAAGIAEVTWSNAAGGAGNAAGTTSWSAGVPLLQGTNSITVRVADTVGRTAWRSLTVVRR